VSAGRGVGRGFGGGNPNWKKGVSGNPGGRTKAHWELMKAAQSHGPESLKTLVRLRDDGESDQIKMGAAIALLDRGFGKPAQTVYTAEAEQRIEDMTDDEIEAALRDLRRRRAGGEPVAGDPAPSGGESEPPPLH
jgi:hypothetical protein